MQNTVGNLLALHGPMLSGKLVNLLIDEQGIQQAAARKRVSRVNGPIKRFHKINFKNNQKFFYLSGQYGTLEFWDSVSEVFKVAAPAYANAIRSLETRGGILPETFWLMSCGSPFLPLRGHPSADRIRQNLEEIGMLHIEGRSGEWGNVYKLPLCISSSQHMKAVLRIEELTLHLIANWASNLGLSAYKKYTVIGSDMSSTEFAGFVWGCIAPCYLREITTKDPKNGGKVPGFFVADIHLDGIATLDVVTPFISKITIARNHRTARPFLPCFIAQSIDRESLSLLRKHNVLIGLVDNVFGTDIGELLVELIHCLERATEIAVEHPEKINELLKKILKIEGATLNLRGDLFELMVGHYFSRDGAQIEINTLTQDGDSEQTAEVDVLAKYGEKTVVVECKGKKHVSKDEIERWLTTRVPRIRKWLLERKYPQPHHFQFWSTTIYDEETKDFLKGRTEATKRYNLSFLDIHQVMNAMAQKRLNSIVSMITEHYQLAHYEV